MFGFGSSGGGFVSTGRSSGLLLLLPVPPPGPPQPSPGQLDTRTIRNEPTADTVQAPT